MVDIDSSVPDPLDQWFDENFHRYGKLKQRTKRASLIVAPHFEEGTEKYEAPEETKQVARWELNDVLQDQAPRDALTTSEDECRQIREKLLAQVPLMDGAPERDPDTDACIEQILSDIPDTIVCPKSGQPVAFADVETSMGQTSDLGSDEVPIGFKKTPLEGGSFTLENVSWLQPPTHLYNLRNFFGAEDGGDKLLAKAQRKTYGTDRRQTGRFKTNRENRWEAHPQDPQAASRWECWKVEEKLLAQLFSFADAPEIPSHLEDPVTAIIGTDSLSDSTFHCPITGNIIYYPEFVDVVRDADHGRSEYHVGHLDPLAMDGATHERENITWITERGNRVQGDDSLQHTVEIIFSMAKYHMERLDLDWEEAKEWTAESEGE
jgi:hypothetical protein